jgi:site-specific recombinase XerD
MKKENSMETLLNFQAYLTNRDRSPKTVHGYGSDLRQFEKWLGRPLESMTNADVRMYRDYLFEKGASANTISRHLASLASFGMWGETRGGLFAENPALHVEQVEVSMLAPRWLTKVQKKRLLNVIEEDARKAKEKYPRLWLLRFRDAVMVRFLLHTGLRVGELCDLRLSDLTLGERKGSVLVRRGKGRKQRVVMLMNETRKDLAEWLKVRPPVLSDCLFVGQVGDEIQPRLVQRVVQRYAEAAEIEDLTPHVLRHTFARSLLDSGATPFEVAKLLGHSSLDSTMRYTQPSEEDLRNAVERLGEG